MVLLSQLEVGALAQGGCKGIGRDSAEQEKTEHAWVQSDLWRRLFAEH